ncbi:MAG: diguanylate cyclase (GGDEF)-like protein/PAS domain S-box-containing protein, partial [Candidatus Omnitrophota bacterium]
MLINYLLTTSVLIQLVASGILIYLISVTGRYRAWIAIGSAVIVYATRSTLILMNSLGYTEYFASGGNVEILHLIASLLLLSGCLFLIPVFNHIRNSAEKLKHSEEKFSTFMKYLPGIAYIIDDKHNVVYFNQGFSDLAGVALKESKNKSVYECFPKESHKVLKENNEWVLKKRKSLEVIESIYKNNRQQFFLSYKFPINNGNGDLFMGGVSVDVTELKNAEEDLRKLSRAVEQSLSSVVIVDVEGNVEYVNRKFTESMGYKSEEVLGQPCRNFVFGKVSGQEYKRIWESVILDEDWKGEIEKTRKDGETYWEYVTVSSILAPNNSVTHFVAVQEDISLRKEYESRLVRQTNYDELTGLPNRFLAFDRLQQAVTRSSRQKRKVAVMFIDLDQFKYVNDTLGHTAGDHLLIEVTQRLRVCVRDSDTIARLGGDEFLIILPDLQEDSHSEIVAQKIIDSFTESFDLEGNEVFITASIGISMYPTDGDDPHALLRNADIAMYRAKDISRNTFKYFTKEMNEVAVQRLAMDAHLRNALSKEEFYLVYQPIVDMSSGVLHGVEVLLRWQNEELGNVTPDSFIPLAEETGVIVGIGTWVLTEACCDIKKIQDEFDVPLLLSVNVSYKQIESADFIECVKKALEESRLDASHLQLEITERLLMEDTPKTFEILKILKQMGIRIALDDFGTGYSSLGYLKKFSFNVLKLDQSFVRGITTRSTDAALAQAIIAMAQNLNLEVVAEGVETKK